MTDARERTHENDGAREPAGNGGFTRRQAIGAGIAGAAVLAGISAAGAGGTGTPPATPAAAGSGSPTTANGARQPVVFLPHGGGPWPFVDTGIGSPEELGPLAAYLRAVAEAPPVRPNSLLVVSAHWEERVPTLMTNPRPALLFDYYGFPPESYTLTWPAPGDPGLAARVAERLAAAGIPSAVDADRGFDHGTFVPLKLAYPEADVPTIQLSLKKGLDPAEHLAIGRALAPLRDEGVFLVASGMSYHNLRAFGPSGRPVAEAFDAWLRETAAAPPAERDERLRRWAEAPAARQAHPREEHLAPLFVAAGAAGDDRGTTAFAGTILGLRVSGYRFG